MKKISKKYINRPTPSSSNCIRRTILCFSVSIRKYHIHSKFLCNKRSSLKLYYPIKPDTYKTKIGQFIASHKFNFEVNPNNKIPFKNYKDVIDHLTNNQLYILKKNYKKYWLITRLLSLGISLYWSYSQYLKDTSISKKALH